MRLAGNLGIIAGGAPGPTGAVVSKAPTGPATPASGWSVALADAFGAALGTGGGQDNLWWPNTDLTVPFATYQPPHNSNELQAFNSSAVRITSEGLALDCTHSAEVAEITDHSGGKRKVDYVAGECSSVWGEVNGKPAGYNFFRWKPCQGGAYVFEVVAKVPLNTGEMDPSWWSFDARNTGSAKSWNNELDLCEFYGWPTNVFTGKAANNYFGGMPFWKYHDPENSGSNGFNAFHELYDTQGDLGFNPANAFHRYTTVINPDNSLEQYVDGALKWKIPGSNANGLTSPGAAGSPPSSANIEQVWMGLVLTCALRRPSSAAYSTAPNFTAGTRTLNIRSIACYRDGAHAGVGVEGGGVAPGTTVV